MSSWPLIARLSETIGRAPGPVAPFTSIEFKVARLRAAFGFAQAAPPSSPSTFATRSLSGKGYPLASAAAMNSSAFASACLVCRAVLKAMSAHTSRAARTTAAVT